MKIRELEDELGQAQDAEREVVIEDQDGRLLTIDMARDHDGIFALIAGDEISESQRQ